MVYRFLIVSDEVEDFKREIQIDAEATFLELHEAILQSVGFKPAEMCSFFICEDDWTRRTEITLIDMGAPTDADTCLMEDTRLEEFLEDEHQRLIYVFDYMFDRAFYMELREIITGRTLQEAVCTRSVGEPPEQAFTEEELEKDLGKVLNTTTTAATGEDFYGDSEYDDDELDREGMGGFDDGDTVDLSDLEERY